MSTAFPATFLELSQRLCSETGISLTGPSATSGQTGRLGQAVNWINSAWVDIQSRYDDWRFMRSSFTVPTTSGDGKYAITECTDTVSSSALTVAGFRDWCRDSFKIYLTSAGVGTETNLCYVSYQEWYDAWNFGSPSNSYPRDWTMDHDRAILLGPKPDGIYTVRGEYMKAATELSSDTDEPELPKEYRMAIVYRAMMMYGRYTGASEVYTDGENNYKRLLAEMIRTQRPRRIQAGTLA